MDFRKIAAVFIVLLVATPALAFEGLQKNNKGTAISLYDATVPFEFDAKWRLSTLMNEPVKNLVIRWEFPFGAEIVGENLTSFENYKTSFPIQDLPKSIQDTIRLYDVKVKVGFSQFSGQGRLSSADVIFDAGIPSKPGKKWGFNASGSPAWEKFAMRPGNNGFLSTKDAQSFLKNKKLYSVWAHNVSAKVTLGEALRWLRKKSDKAPLEYMLKGARKHLSVIKKYAGLPIEDIKLEFEILENQLDRASNMDALDHVREKLIVSLENLKEGVPDRYLVPTLKKEYEAEKLETAQWVDTQVAQLNKSIKNFKKDNKKYTHWLDRKNVELANASDQRKARLSKLNLAPEQQTNGKFWGYKAKGHDEWVVAPRYLSAGRFNSADLANVILTSEKRYVNVKKGGRCGSKTYWEKMNVTYYKHVNIDKSGNQVGDANWRSARTRSSLVLCSKRS